MPHDACHRPQTTDDTLHASRYTLHTTHFTLFTIHYSLLTACPTVSVVVSMRYSLLVACFVLQFYGMSSSTAMQKHSGGVANYRSSEGKTVEVLYRGPVESTLFDLFGGIRSTCTYIGAATIKEMPKRTTFIRVTQQLNQVFGSHDLGKK